MFACHSKPVEVRVQPARVGPPPQPYRSQGLNSSSSGLVVGTFSHCPIWLVQEYCLIFNSSKVSKLIFKTHHRGKIVKKRTTDSEDRSWQRLETLTLVYQVCHSDSVCLFQRQGLTLSTLNLFP